MNKNVDDVPLYRSVEITDDEHTLILLMRTMKLNEITCVMKLNENLPIELPNRYHHIMNMINLYFKKSYEIHTIKSIIDFISTNSTYSQVFVQYSVDELIKKYQEGSIVESVGVYELYLRPYTTQCVQCQKELKLVFSHRSKTVLSLKASYEARKW